jgi:hypothetical protein
MANANSKLFMKEWPSLNQQLSGSKLISSAMAGKVEWAKARSR